MSEAAQFGDRLRALRDEAGITQQELAGRIGVQWQMVSRWERNERVPTWVYIQALADALGVTCEAFRAKPEPAGAEKAGEP